MQAVQKGITDRGRKKENSSLFRKEGFIMALKTEWQKRQEAAGAREYARWDWLYGYKERKVQIRKALYLEGYKVNYPFRKR